MINPTISHNNDLVIAKAREGLLDAIRFYLSINKNLISLKETTRCVSLDIYDQTLDMTLSLKVKPISLEETVDGVVVRYTIDEGGYDPGTVHTHLLEEATLTDCTNILYAIETLPINGVRQYFLNGPDEYCETVANELARSVGINDSYEEIERIARKAKRFYFGKSTTTFGGTVISFHKDAGEAEGYEKEYRKGYRHFNDLGEMDNFITVKMTAYEVSVKVNRWDYGREVKKYENKKKPYDE